MRKRAKEATQRHHVWKTTLHIFEKHLKPHFQASGPRHAHTSDAMRPPRGRAAQRRVRMMAQTDELLRLLDLLDLLDQLDDLDSRVETDPIMRRSALLHRQRRPWDLYIRPMLGDKTFADRFRMEHEDFLKLVEVLRPALQRNEKMGALRNGAIPVEYQLAITLRWLAGGSIYEGMGGHVIARSTAYAIVHRVVDALNACSGLDCSWPSGADALLSAALFKKRSDHGVIGKALGAMDGLFLRLRKPSRRDHGASHNFFSGHKKGHGMNLQVGSVAAYIYSLIFLGYSHTSTSLRYE